MDIYDILLNLLELLFLLVILATGRAIPIGVALAAMVYWGGSISGGCFNPAVSLAAYMNKSISLNNLIIYIVLQLVAAALAYKL